MDHHYWAERSELQQEEAVNHIMAWSEAEQVCKNHPYHNQKQGVCPSCLRERLSQLYVLPSGNKAAATASIFLVAAHTCSSSAPSSPPYSSSSASSSRHKIMSKAHRHRHQRNGSEVMGSVSFRIGGGGGRDGLKKSRSLAFVSRNIAGEVTNGKKKNGFWTKLLHLKGKKEAPIHSVTAAKEKL